jgi:hypothetical protein
MKQFLLIVLFGLALTACNNFRKNTGNFYSGVLVDRTGLDGCSWMIQLTEKLPDGTEFLEPVNLNEYLKEPQEGKKISFSYVNASLASICMAGLPVRLTGLR